MYNTKNLVENLGTYESMKTVSSIGGGPDAINYIQYRWDVHIVKHKHVRTGETFL